VISDHGEEIRVVKEAHDMTYAPRLRNWMWKHIIRMMDSVASAGFKWMLGRRPGDCTTLTPSIWMQSRLRALDGTLGRRVAGRSGTVARDLQQPYHSLPSAHPSSHRHLIHSLGQNSFSFHGDAKFYGVGGCVAGLSATNLISITFNIICEL